MNFKEIKNNVEKYLDKQQASMLGNSHLINMTIKKLDQYVDTFHFEMKDLLQAENIVVASNLLSNLRKPTDQTDNLSRIGDSDRIKDKLVDLSNRLSKETLNRERKLRSIFAQESDVIDYRNYVKQEINRSIHFNYQGTKLYDVIVAIYYALKHWEGDRTVRQLQIHFKEIKSFTVINEFRTLGVNNTEFFIKGIVDSYRSYFAECLQEYEGIYFRRDEHQDDHMNNRDNEQRDAPINVMDESMNTEVMVARRELSADSLEIDQETEYNIISIEDLELLSVKCRNGKRIELNPKLTSEDFQRELLRLISCSR